MRNKISAEKVTKEAGCFLIVERKRSIKKNGRLSRIGLGARENCVKRLGKIAAAANDLREKISNDSTFPFPESRFCHNLTKGKERKESPDQ